MAKNDLRAYRIASLTLVNAMLLQEILSQRIGKVSTLRKLLDSTDIIGGFNKQWKWIIDNVDFVPIFQIAREILLALPSSPGMYLGIRRLAESALEISKNKAALRHDLMGRIFHRLLADAKFYGAFYTKIPAATLLLKLAIDKNSWRVNWASADSVGKFRIADLACGTGTLLKAALAAIVDRHIETAVSNRLKPKKDIIHKKLIEEGVWGFDVLSSAVHLAATSIALHDPDVAVQTMRLYALPLGGKTEALGSIDLASGRKLYVQKTLIGASLGPENAISKRKITTEVPMLHLCTMNPPFTRSVYGNLLFGGITKKTERRKLQRKLRKVLNKRGLQANITAGLGSVFVALGDRLLMEGGVFALVLPKAVLSGVAWEPTRRIFGRYHLQYVIASHEPHNWNFSESTDLSEVLLILKKLPRHSNKDRTIFINLWTQPKSNVEALTLVSFVKRSIPGRLDAKSGVCELRANGTKFGEISELSLEKHHKLPWSLPVAFAQTELCRVAFNLTKGVISFPGEKSSARIKMIQLSKIATLGPDGRDVYDGFSLTDSETPYPALWGYDAKAITKISQSANAYLNPLTHARPNRSLRDSQLLWSRSGTLMLPKELWLTTCSMAAVVLPKPALSNVWWPTRWTSENEKERKIMERRLAVWFNSTLGFFTMLMQRQETRGAWVKFPKAWYKQLMVLDLKALSRSDAKRLDSLWKRIQQKDFLPYPSIRNDSTRIEIDEYFSETLGLPKLDILREMLSREPVISMGSTRDEI